MDWTGQNMRLSVLSITLTLPNTWLAILSKSNPNPNPNPYPICSPITQLPNPCLGKFSKFFRDFDPFWDFHFSARFGQFLTFYEFFIFGKISVKQHVYVMMTCRPVNLTQLPNTYFKHIFSRGNGLNRAKHAKPTLFHQNFSQTACIRHDDVWICTPYPTP